MPTYNPVPELLRKQKLQPDPRLTGGLGIEEMPDFSPGPVESPESEQPRSNAFKDQLSQVTQLPPDTYEGTYEPEEQPKFSVTGTGLGEQEPSQAQGNLRLGFPQLVHGQRENEFIPEGEGEDEDIYRKPNQFSKGYIDELPPDFSTQHPALDRLNSTVDAAPEISDPQYQAGKLRKVLSRIAGIGLGVTGDIGGGMALQRDLEHGKYNQARREYEDKFKHQSAAAKLEGESERRLQAIQTSKATEAWRRAQEQKAVNEANNPVYHPDRQDTFDLAAIRNKPRPLAPKGPFIVETKDGATHHGVLFNPEKGYSLDGVSIAEKDIKKVHSTDANEPVPNQYRDYITAWKAENPGKNPTTKDIIAYSENKIPDSLEAMRILSAALSQEKLKTEKSKSAPDAIAYNVEQMKKNPDYFHDLDPDVKSMTAQAWTAATGMPPPVKLPPERKSMEGAAKLSIGHVQQIKKMLQEKPELRQRIGPIVGNIGRLEQWTGGSIPGVPDHLQADAQNLRYRFRVLLFQEGKAVMGAQRGQALLELLKQASPREGMNINMLAGALKSIEDVSKLTMDNIDAERFGGQSGGREGQNLPESVVGKDGQTYILNKQTGKYRVQGAK